MYTTSNSKEQISMFKIDTRRIEKGTDLAKFDKISNERFIFQNALTKKTWEKK